jgi:Flp pilus assembly pilin Flp
LTIQALAARLDERLSSVPSFNVRTEVDFLSSSAGLNGSKDYRARHRALEQLKGGGFSMGFSFSDWIAYFRARFGVEEGQTMAEYGVVLAVIALGVLVAFTALSGGISKAIDKVTAILG